MQTLSIKKHVRCALRARVEQATAARVVLSALTTTKQNEVARLEAGERSWIKRHSKKLTDWTSAGSKGAAPALVADAKAQAVLAGARADAAAAAQALARAEAAEREVRAELGVAEAAVREAAAETLLAEVLRRDVPKLEALRAEAAALEVSLRALRDVLPNIPAAIAIAAADDLHTPTDLLRARGDFDVPVHELAGHTSRAATGTDAWRSRLADLEAGDGDDTAEDVAA